MDVRLPNLGEDADSGTVAAVFVKVGDRVELDQGLVELESEKAIASVPSPAAGRVAAIHVKEGDEIRTGALLITLDPAGEESAKRQGKAEETETGKDAALPFPPAQPRLGPVTTKPPSPSAPETPLPSGLAPAASPTIRKLARDLGIDLGRVRPTARGGRIVLGDLRDYIARLQTRAAGAGASGTAPSAAPSVDFSQWGPVEAVPASAIRKTIASRMVDSWTRVPHVTQFADADIGGLMALRAKYVGVYKERGARLTLTPIILRALVRVLARHPLLNSSLDEEAMTIVIKKYYHFGLAVDTEGGLIVPVIQNVDQKSLFDLAGEVEQLADRARDRKLTREEIRGGTITISNQGGIGGAYFTPIINYPEVAILGIGRGRDVVRMADSGPEPRPMLPLALSHDHRVVDGADGVRFLVDLVKELEKFPESEFDPS